MSKQGLVSCMVTTMFLNTTLNSKQFIDNIAALLCFDAASFAKVGS